MKGGNVMIGSVGAERIDLKTIDRKKVVTEVSIGLKALSDKFKSIHGMALWSNDLLKSGEFLSGSSLHLFDLSRISDEDFLKHKPTVGDIDTQVDGSMKDPIEKFLKALPSGAKVGNMIYVGYKPSGDQFITLWNIPTLNNINVQVDLELVAFVNGKPTPWSSFSHSSAWDDIKTGIKGVFQKYLLRSFSARTARSVLIQANTPRGKDKIITKSDLAFSLKGLRVRMVPVLDSQGNQLYKNDMPVYKETDSKTAEYITDFDVLFSSFFGAKGTPTEIKQMESFNGLIGLMKKYMNKVDQKKVLDGFVNVLWEKGAQGLVRGNPQEDYQTKMAAFNIIADSLGMNDIEKYRPIIDAYYKGYK